MEGKDTRHRKKRKDLKSHKKRPDLKPNSAIEAILESSDSDESSTGRAYSKKSIESNWSRYDEPGPSEAERFAEDPGGADFSELAANPPAIADYFQFQAEKEWGKKIEADPDADPARKRCDEYFKLDMDLLAAGLKTIPFYQRLDFEKSEFSPALVKKMEAEAEAAEPYYKRLAKQHEEKMEKFYAEALHEDWLKQLQCDDALPAPRPAWFRDWPWGPAFGPGQSSAEMDVKSPEPSEIPEPIAPQGSSPKAAKNPEPTPGPAPKADENDPELDELLKLTNRILSYSDEDAGSSKTVKSATKSEKAEDKKTPEVAKADNPEKQEDIQQWLDDVLNE